MPAPEALPGILFRPATAADQATITAFIRAAGINPMSLKWPNFLLAVDAATGEVVGTGQIKTHGDGSRELASIATKPAYQGRGIAGAIIRQLIAKDTAESTAPLYLTCRSPMEPFYLRFGFRTLAVDEMPPYFRRIKRLANFVGRFIDLGFTPLVMQYDLKPPAQP